MNIAVNLTARQFADEHLLEDIASILAETGMDARLLELEMAESLLIRDVEKTMRILTALKSMGIRLAIDDFGAGYSSLTTLQTISARHDQDRSIVHSRHHERRSRTTSSRTPSSRWGVA